MKPAVRLGACRQLTRALLHSQYNLHWWVPDGHLIPPVTNRANYIRWLHTILSLCPGEPSRAQDIVRGNQNRSSYGTDSPALTSQNRSGRAGMVRSAPCIQHTSSQPSPGE